jgi:hypothetical protein
MPGERLLWHGRPDGKAYVSYKHLINLKIVATLFCAIMAVAAIGGGPIVRVGQFSVWLAIAGILWISATSTANSKNASRIYYALTDRRILILFEKSPDVSYENLSIADLRPVFKEGADGFGTILFGTPRMMMDCAFIAIPNARDVMRMLEEARQGAAGATTGGAFGLSHAMLEQRLEPGEQMLWQGKPNIAIAMLSQGIPGMVSLAVLFAGAVILPMASKHLLNAVSGSLITVAMAGAFGWMMTLMIRETSQTYFGVTDRRVIHLFSGIGVDRFSEVLLTQLQFMDQKKESGGLTTIAFGALYPREFRFRYIEKGQEVFALVSDARARALAAEEQSRARAQSMASWTTGIPPEPPAV